MAKIEERIANCDISLFDHVASQTSDADRRSLLALQAACRQQVPDFVYLEIGSHLGGTLQPYVVDPCCKAAISIDLRPPVVPDARGFEINYPDNDTARMMRNLAAIPNGDIAKVHTLQETTSELSPSEIPAVPDLCLVDAEHTDEAVLRDARFCLSVLDGRGAIVFHDSQILYRALHAFVEELKTARISCRPYVLPLAIFVVEIGDLTFLDNEHVQDALVDNYTAYLWALRANDNHWNRVKKQLAAQRARRKMLRAHEKTPESP